MSTQNKLKANHTRLPELDEDWFDAKITPPTVGEWMIISGGICILVAVVFIRGCS